MVLSFDPVADIYDETRCLPNWVLQEFYRTILKEAQIGHSSIVLDAGVGTGRTIDDLISYGVELVGVDISRKMLEKLIQKIEQKNISSQIHLTLSDVTSLPFKDSSFDLITAVHILHLVNLKKFVFEARRVLRSNGCLVVSTSGVGEAQSRVGQKYTELLDEYCGNRKTLRFLLLKYFVRKVYKIRFFGLLLDIIKKYVNWVTFLRNNACSIETKIFRWEEQFDTSAVLERLENRPFSFQWDISVEAHKEIMHRLRNWIAKQRRTNFVEKIERRFEIVIVRF